MSLRVVLRSPFGDQVVRDIVDGRWAEPSGVGDDTLGEGMWALPGLADAHSHLPAARLDYRSGDPVEAMERARHALSAGVTLILDKGWCDDTTMRVIESVPPTERPDIEAAARVLAAVDGHVAGFAREVPEGELGQAVREEAGSGAGWVKMFGDWPRKGRGPVANFTEGELRQAVGVAESLGARVAVHTMAREAPSLAVAAGAHSIEHGMFLEEDDLETLAGRGGMWVPTVLRCEMTLAQLGEGSSGGRLFVEGLERFRRLLPLGVEAGVHVLAGTDLVGTPSDVGAEAIALGRYGLSNHQALRSVSTAAFAATGRDHSFTPGVPADAVLFPADPLIDLGVLAHPARVIRRGQVR
ncbi:MAG TPA: amidohydrolase family protein [Acidimicrobiia bacterium]|nr:amidohydrolase family protein [Acidimicrobiia bacterium]